jgi:hypothetical protein
VHGASIGGGVRTVWEVTAVVGSGAHAKQAVYTAGQVTHCPLTARGVTSSAHLLASPASLMMP